MIRVSLEWHDTATEGKPRQSGHYFAMTDSGHIYYVEYSAHYRLFNTFDADDEDHAHKAGWNDVTYWAETPDKLSKLHDKMLTAWLEREGERNVV